MCCHSLGPMSLIWGRSHLSDSVIVDFTSCGTLKEAWHTRMVVTHMGGGSHWVIRVTSGQCVLKRAALQSGQGLTVLCLLLTTSHKPLIPVNLEEGCDESEKNFGLDPDQEAESGISVTSCVSLEIKTHSHWRAVAGGGGAAHLWLETGNFFVYIKMSWRGDYVNTGPERSHPVWNTRWRYGPWPKYIYGFFINVILKEALMCFIKISHIS